MANSEPVVIASDQSAVPVSAASLPLPTGAATAANQSTIIGHVDGIEGILTTMDADTGAISLAAGATGDAASTVGGTGSLSAKSRLMTTQLDAIQTAVQLLDNAIAGSEMQVDVVAALPAGTNNIGDVDVLTLPAIPTGANTIGSIASITTSVVPGTAATNLGKAEDAAHTTGDVGVMALAVRRDTATASSGTSGDYEPLSTDSVGAQWVRSTAEHNDDGAFTLGTNRVMPVGGVAVNMDGTDPSAVSAENDVNALRSDPNRILLVNQTHPRFFRASADYASAQTNTTVVAAPGASLSLYITDVIISNGATAGNITLLDGSGGTVLLELYPAINGGLTHSFRNPLKLTANTLLAITSTTVTTHSVTVTGYIAA
jgi:hypothetical protein